MLDPKGKAAALAESNILAALDQDDLEALAEATVEEEHRPHSVILLESNLNQDLLMIVQGQVEILQKLDREDLEPVAELGPGDVLGEMALIEDKPRNARAIARERVVLLRVPRQLADRMIWGCPDAARLLAQTALDRVRLSAWKRIEKLHARLAEAD